MSSWPLLQRLNTSKIVDLIALTPRAAKHFDVCPKGLLVSTPNPILRQNWKPGNVLIVIGAIGAATRLIAPLLINKEDDPAVLVMDSRGSHIVPLLGGHKAGAEKLSLELAEYLGSKALLTGDSFIQNRLPLDSFGNSWGWKRSGDRSGWQKLMVAQANEGSICIYQQSGSSLWRNSEGALKVTKPSEDIESSFDLKLLIGAKASNNSCTWHPAMLWIGIGCERNTSQSLLDRSLKIAMEESGLAIEAVAGLASINLKKDEKSILALAEQNDWPSRFYDSVTLSKVLVPNPSSTVKLEVGTSSVAEAAAILAAGEGGSLIREKSIYKANNNEIGAVTIAIAESVEPFAPQRGELHLIGSGPGDLAFLTHDARSALSRSAIWIGYARYMELIEPFRRSDQVRIDSQITFEKERCKQAYELARQGVRVALISSGESGIYGMAGLALELYLEQPENERPLFQVHPGITAMQLAAAKTGAPLMNDFCSISLSDLLTPWSKIQERIKGAAIGDFVIAFYNPKSSGRDWQLEAAIEILKESRLGSTPVALARQLGRSDEEISFFSLDSLELHKVDMLSIVLIGNSRSLYKDGWLVSPRGYLVN